MGKKNFDFRLKNGKIAVRRGTKMKDNVMSASAERVSTTSAGVPRAALADKARTTPASGPRAEPGVDTTTPKARVMRDSSGSPL